MSFRDLFLFLFLLSLFSTFIRHFFNFHNNVIFKLIRFIAPTWFLFRQHNLAFLVIARYRSIEKSYFTPWEVISRNWRPGLIHSFFSPAEDFRSEFFRTFAIKIYNNSKFRNLKRLNLDNSMQLNDFDRKSITLFSQKKDVVMQVRIILSARLKDGHFTREEYSFAPFRL